jgi:hypothetical protein
MDTVTVNGEIIEIDEPSSINELDEFGEKCDILSYDDLIRCIMSSRELSVSGLPKSPIVIRRKSIRITGVYPGKPNDEYMYALIRHYIQFDQCSFIECNFDNRIIKHTFTSCKFVDCSFRDSKIISTVFDQCTFYSTNFKNSTIKDSNILRCYSDCAFNHIKFMNTRLCNNSISFVKSKNIDAKQIVPSTGAFIGWKKAIPVDSSTGYRLPGYVIVKLQILASSKRVGINRKCRCNKAKVLKMYRIDEEGKKLKDDISCAISIYNSDFVYKVGETVEVSLSCFDEEPNECSNGIHFFLTEQEAIDY